MESQRRSYIKPLRNRSYPFVENHKAENLQSTTYRRTLFSKNLIKKK